MVPNDDEPKPALPVVGSITTYTYTGPITRQRNSASGNDKLHERLVLIDGATRLVTCVYDLTGRVTRTE